MALSVRCGVCRNDYKLGTAKCKKCGNNITKNHKYKVACKLPSGKWKSKVVDNLNLARKVEAKFIIETVEEQVNDTLGNNQSSPFIADIWNLYLDWAKVNKKSWKNDVIRWEKHVFPILGNQRMNKVTPQHINSVMASMKTKMSPKGTPYKPETVKHVLCLMKGVYNWAIRQEVYIGPNPCTRVPSPKFDNRVTNPLCRDDLKRLITYLGTYSNERASLIVKFALYSGRRRGEILALKWHDIDLENDFITFSGDNTKNSQSQTLPINQKCRNILLRCKEMATCEYVFPSRNNKKYTAFYSSWRIIKAKTNINIRFHDLRHTFASYLASSGEVDIYTLKELLGHKSITMTQRYAHLINGALRRGVEVADRVF